MYELYKVFWNQTHHSIIANFYCNIIRYIFDCPNCDKYFSYSMKNIFRINVKTVKYFRDLTYPERINNKINLDECFRCYSGAYKKNCLNCNNENAKRYTRIIIPANVLIISLERKKENRNYQGDIFFEQNFDLANFISTTRAKNKKSKYILKACISFDGKKYLADCYLKNEGNWYRFIDENKEKLSSFEEIYKYEPQMLIYELDNNNNNQDNNINQFYLNNNKNIINNNNLINNNNNINNINLINQNFNNNNNNFNLNGNNNGFFNKNININDNNNFINNNININANNNNIINNNANLNSNINNFKILNTNNKNIINLFANNNNNINNFNLNSNNNNNDNNNIFNNNNNLINNNNYNSNLNDKNNNNNTNLIINSNNFNNNQNNIPNNNNNFK